MGAVSERFWETVPLERMTRAGRAQISSEMAMIRFPALAPKKAARTIINGMNGSTSTTSTRRISVASVRPPRKPAMTPTRVPITMASAAAVKPMLSDTRVPTINSDRMSCPMSFVPSQCAALGAENGAPVCAAAS